MARRFGRLERLPSGNYRASFMHEGVRHFAPVTFDREQDADTWLAVQRADIARGTWAQQNRGTVTLRDYALEWFASRKDLKPRTVALYSGLLDRHILPELGDVPLRDLSAATVRRWHRALGERTGPTAVAQSYRLLRAICNQAVRDGELTASPCQLRGAGAPATQERPIPSIADVLAIADAVPARYRALVLVASFGGLRFGELTALRRCDVELSGRLPEVQIERAMHRIKGAWVVGTPKTVAGRRTVALPTSLAGPLGDHMANYVADSPDALVFATRTGKPLNNANWCQTFHRTLTRLGLPAYHFHDCRHAAATLAAQSGATLKDTMARLGHASPRAALIYQHSARDRDEAIAAALDTAMANVVQLDSHRRPA